MIYGWYTGKHCLPYYFDPSGHRKADWKNARRIVNVLDRWLIIADHSKKFLAALEQAQIPIVPPPPSEVADSPTAEPTTSADVAARLVAAERARADAQTQLQAMTDEIARVSKSNEGLRQQITRMADQAKTRQEIFAALRADDAAARQRIEELKSAKADAAAENGELRAANAGLSERISAQNTQIAALRTHIEALSDSNGVETDALAAENQRLTAQNTTLRQKVGQLDKRLDDVSSTLDAMRAINESLEAESRQAAHDRELVLAERADIRAQVTDKERRIAQLGALKHTLQRQVTSLEARLSAATAERDAMKAELEKSWWNFW
jgi:chromosome segregation ATPase